MKTAERSAASPTNNAAYSGSWPGSTVRSNDRPPTKFLKKQKSHTLSWTVVLKSLQSAGTNTQLKEFLEKLLVRWTSLKQQDWDGMIREDLKDAPRLITSDDYGRGKSVKGETLNQINETNRARLKDLKAKIDPNIAHLEEALGDKRRSDLDWTKFLQQTISDYEVAFAQEAALERRRRQQLRQRAVNRSKARRIASAQSRGKGAFGTLLAALIVTVVTVTLVMFETLAWLMG